MRTTAICKTVNWYVVQCNRLCLHDSSSQQRRVRLFRKSDSKIVVVTPCAFQRNDLSEGKITAEETKPKPQVGKTPREQRGNKETTSNAQAIEQTKSAYHKHAPVESGTMPKKMDA